jgi:phosphatidylglycerophosphate synthase
VVSALGRVADLLTLVRLGAAPSLAAALAADGLAIAAALLAGAWLTDALDGQAARASGRRTYLGRFDLVVDTAVGAGALVGLTLADEMPALLTGFRSERRSASRSSCTGASSRLKFPPSSMGSPPCRAGANASTCERQPGPSASY